MSCTRFTAGVTRERAGAAMAAVDRRNPNLVDFVGLNWSCWTDGVDIEPPDVPSEDTKYGRYCSETMTLRKEDMAIYGHCPAQDEFFLVVCSHCGQVVKPQAFEEHCVRRHGSLTKVYGQSNTTLQQQPQPSRPPSNVSRDRQRDRCKETSVPSTTRRTAKPQKEAVRLPQMGNISQNKPHSSSMQRPRSHPQKSGPLLPSHSSPPSSSSSLGLSSVKPSVPKPTAAQTSQSQSNSPQRETRTYSRLHKNIKKELNKKLEGPDPDKKKLYIQEPTLSMDSTRQQLRKTDSVQSTVEHRPAATSPRDSEQLPAKSKAMEHLGAFSEKSSRCNEFQLNSNSHIVGLKDVSETSPAEDGDSPVEVQPPSLFNQSLLSSDNSDNDEENTDLPTTSWHPKPLGLCTFGSRAFGCSFFTFDRRLHHLHIAVSAMLEDHVNSHLCKKMHQPSSNLRSQHAPPSTPVRTGARPIPAGSHSLNSTSLERLKIKNTPNNSKRTRSPPSVSIGPGQQRTSVGQPNKSRLGETQNTKIAQKATLLSLSTSSQHVPSSHVPVSGTLSKKVPPLSPLHPSKRNSSVLNESHPKPCPPHSKGRPPEIQPKLGSCDERGLVQKRKSQSPVPSSSPSKKCQRLSPPSRSGVFSWKRDSSQDVWLGVWRKDQISGDNSQGQTY